MLDLGRIAIVLGSLRIDTVEQGSEGRYDNRDLGLEVVVIVMHVDKRGDDFRTRVEKVVQAQSRRFEFVLIALGRVEIIRIEML